MDTKKVTTISLTSYERTVLLEKMIHLAACKEVSQIIAKVTAEFEELLKRDWLKIKNKDVYYSHDAAVLLPDLKMFECGASDAYNPFDPICFKKDFSGFSGRLMTELELMRAFINKRVFLKCEFGDKLPEILTAVRHGNPWAFTIDGTDSYAFNSIHRGCFSIHVPAFSLLPIETPSIAVNQVLVQFVYFDLIPAGLTAEVEDIYCALKDLCHQEGNILFLQGNALGYNEEFLVEQLIAGVLKKGNGAEFNVNDVMAHLPSQLNERQCSEIYSGLLRCDLMRCGLEAYDEKILIDPNRGHWDLWRAETSAADVSITKSLMARNPLADIRHDGVIGIDFGTKSTVVVYQEASDYTLPMRIGTGQLSKAVEDIHFENPTVMEFIDLEKFLERYHEEKGRPHTLWEQVTTSHTAYSSLLHSPSEDYYSFLYELKQWAGDEQRRLRLKDKMGQDRILPPFLEINEDSFNPIELYAYYIGLNINNMHNGIYIDYLLSFPVTYAKAVQDKILESFRKGIKKSLPETLQEDVDTMKAFKVRAGSSEPAAYAICALQEYGFAPEGEEKVFYGVFDFGGGTTDFDFGVWREAGQSERRYDYVVECFGAGGDKYLGGENLLELLAFEVFKANQERFREHGISFTLPPECNKFPGSELLLSDSQEAKLNMAQLMEKLRPYWENRQEEFQGFFEAGTIKVSLFAKDGSEKLNFELALEEELLSTTIYQRIGKGVRNFFENLRLAFSLPITKDIKAVHIFLAGNSCKSPVVGELFNSYIEEEGKKLAVEDGEEDYFKVYPPLGSKEAQELQEILGIMRDNQRVQPTCKTGVAYGLIASRPGGKIKIIQKNTATEEGEIRFKYYIGYDRKKRFCCLSNRDIRYGEWQEFVEAEEADFTIYYSDLPEASTNNMDIAQVKRKKCSLGQAYPTGVFVYYRAVSPNVIEYAVARQGKEQNGELLEEIVSLSLS